MKLVTLMGATVCAVWMLVSCSDKPGPDRAVITGPIVHPAMKATWQEVDMENPPASALPSSWKPGDPTIDPDDFEYSGTEAITRESWFSRLLRRICCAVFSCKPEPVEPTPGPREPTYVTGVIDFAGISGTSFVVPDPTGDIGPNHYVQAVNSAFRVFDRTGNPLTEPLLISYLWEDEDGPCWENEPRDPIVRYDKLADRWLISGFVTPSEKYMCIAISQTADPAAGQWFLYTLEAKDPDNSLPVSIDFPKISVWPDAYFLSTIESYTLGLDVWALQRSKMLQGQTAGVIRFYLGEPGIALLPGDPDGPAPPGDSPGWFARQLDGERLGDGGDRVEVYGFSVDWVVTEDSKFDLVDSLAVTSFDSEICISDVPGTDRFDACVPQPEDDSPKLETLSIMPQWRLQYRNMGEHESLLFNHTIDTDGEGHAGVRWYELRRPPGGDWTVAQQGTHADERLHYFMGGISMDGKGNVALGYTASDLTVFPGIRIAHRMAGDAPGTMPGIEYVAVSGGGSQIEGNWRWGDYSTMDVDPVDDCTFWYTNEYYETSSEAGWSTRIVSFKLPGCE